MRHLAFLLILALALTGCVTVTKEYISEVPVEKQIEVPIIEAVTLVKYEQANVFAQQPGIVEIAMMKSPEQSTIEESILTSIYKYVTTIPDLNNKFIVYDESTLKNLLNLSSLTVRSKEDLSNLNKNDIDFVLYLTDISPLADGFILNIIDLSDIEKRHQIEFRNSHESTFLNDLKYFLLQQELPVYYAVDIETGTKFKTVTEIEQRTITHDFKTLPWGGRILLALSLVGIIFIFAQQ